MLKLTFSSCGCPGFPAAAGLSALVSVGVGCSGFPAAAGLFALVFVGVGSGNLRSFC